MNNKIIKVNPKDCPDELVIKVYEILKKGGVVVLPTETVYGVAAALNVEKGLSRLKKIKSRKEDEKPFTVHIGDISQTKKFAKPFPECAKRLAKRYWPGPITIVVEGKETESVGLRVPSRLFTRKVLQLSTEKGLKIGMPSANLKSEPPPVTAQEAYEQIGSKVDLIIDGGKTELSEPSTVIKAIKPKLEVLREGTINKEEVERTACYTVLYVCSGNTCRSPMAEAISKKLAAESIGVPIEEYSKSGLIFFSAGTSALDGLPPSRGALEALKEIGIDISNHRANHISNNLIKRSDIIFCMTKEHIFRVKSTISIPIPDIDLLSPQGKEISDPFGGDLNIYRKTRDEIEKAIRARLKSLLKKPWLKRK